MAAGKSPTVQVSFKNIVEMDVSVATNQQSHSLLSLLPIKAV